MANTSFYTGPTIVGQIAQKFREAGLAVVCEGTQHVWVPLQTDNESEERLEILAKLRKVHGTDFGIR